MLRIIGDAHGRVNHYLNMCHAANLAHVPTVQLGDLGVGFKGTDYSVYKDTRYAENRFIRGNHDNPKVCYEFANYLGDYGVATIGGFNVFFVSGAYSIDGAYRVRGVSWWPEEELNYIQQEDCLLQYESCPKVDIVVSHDCPLFLYDYLKSHHTRIENRPTPKLLEAMYRIKQPRLWFFGHHHKTKCFSNGHLLENNLEQLDSNIFEVEIDTEQPGVKKVVHASKNETTFICLGELASAQITNSYSVEFDTRFERRR